MSKDITSKFYGRLYLAHRAVELYGKAQQANLMEDCSKLDSDQMDCQALEADEGLWCASCKNDMAMYVLLWHSTFNPHQVRQAITHIENVIS